MRPPSWSFSKTLRTSPSGNGLIFAIDRTSWLREADLTEEFYQTFDGRVPAALWAELSALRYRLQRA